MVTVDTIPERTLHLRRDPQDVELRMLRDQSSPELLYPQLRKPLVVHCPLGLRALQLKNNSFSF